MNILHVNMSLDPVSGGGTVERTRQLHKAMNEVAGISSRILSIAIGDTEAILESDDIKLIPCWNKRWYLPAPRILFLYKMVKWADIIHLMSHWTILNVIIYFLARLTNTPYVICPAGALPLFGRSKGFKRCYNRLVGANLVRNCFAAISVAEDESKSLQQYGVAANCIFHIPNGVNQQDFLFSDVNLFRRYIRVDKSEYILFVGRLNSIKGPDLLLESFVALADIFPKIHLVFSGPDGGMLGSLNRSVKEKRLENRVHFTGYIEKELKSSAYHGASMLVVPSRQEAMSIVALEAAICGIPVILTDSCGFDVLSDVGAAKLAQASAESLTSFISLLISSRDMRKTMGRKGRQFVLNNYTWNIAAQRYSEIFYKVMSNK